MRPLLCFSIVLVQLTFGANAKQQDWLFVDRDAEWEAGPPDLGYETATGSITVVRESGQLVRLSCQLYRDSKSSALAFDLKSGYTVSVGHWSMLDENKMQVALRLVGAEKIGVPVNGPQASLGAERREVWDIVGGGSPGDASVLVTTNGKQRRLQTLKNRGDLDHLVKRYLNLASRL
jgi:hypothetical protein